MEWSEDKILELISQGWTLSYDKTNQKYKLQKRINGKVKSYTLPKRFNEFCDKLKKEKELNKYLEIFSDIDKGCSVEEIHEEYKLSYEEVEKIFRKYVEWKLNRNELADLLAKILYEIRFWEIWRIFNLEERLDNASKMVRTAFGFANLKFQCPKCLKTSTLTYDNTIKRWVCSICGKIPF